MGISRETVGSTKVILCKFQGCCMYELGFDPLSYCYRQSPRSKKLESQVVRICEINCG